MLLAGRYDVQEVLGTGGIGEVYLVADRLNGGQLIALKQLRADTLSRTALQSLQREFRLLSNLRHPHLAEVYDFALTPFCYLTMEHVQGLPWHEAGLSGEEQVAGAIQLLRALAYIHQRGLVHLDVKPQNVLVERRSDGLRIKLMDFGVARDPRDREGFGFTSGFAAPEVVFGMPFDQRADLYSVGMLLGLEQLGPTTATKTGDAVPMPIQEEGPVLGLSHLPRAVWPIVERLVSPEPAKRLPSADAVREALEAVTPTPGRAVKTTLLQTAELVAREAALTRLRDARSEALCLSGPTGSGKTRLLAELKAIARLRGDTVVLEEGLRQRGVALSVMRRTLFQLAAVASIDVPELVHQLLFPSQDARHDPDVQKPLLAAAVDYTVHVSETLPIVLLIDDFDALDATSRSYLAAVAARRARLLIVIAAAQAPEHFAPLPLAPFAAGDGPALARSLFARDDALPADTARRLCAHARGDAGLFLELLRLGSDLGLDAFVQQEWPSALEQAAARRMQLRTETAQEVLAAAALLGSTCDVKVLGEALGQSELRWQLTDLLAEGFFVAFEQRFAFANAPIWNAALRLAEARGDVSDLSKRLARALEASGEAEDIARLYARTDEPHKAIPFYDKAAEQALAVYDYEHAEALLRSALAIADTERLRLKLAQSALWRGDFQTAEKEASAVPGPEALRLAGLAATSLGRLDVAIERLTAAGRVFAERGELVQQAQALNELGLAHMYAVRFDVALSHHEQALALLQTVPRAQAAHALAATEDNLGFANLSLGNFAQCHKHLSAALVLHRELGDLYGEAVTQNHLGNMWRHQGDATRAKAAYDASMALCVKSGNQLRQAITLNNLGALCDEAGEYKKAIGLFEQALAMVRAMGDRIREGDNMGCIAICELRLDQPERAVDLFDRAVAIRRELSDWGYLVTDLSFRARAHVARGRREAARADVDEALRLLDGGVFGVEQPQNVFLNAYWVLDALHDAPAARAVLRRGVDMVRAQCATAVDEEHRRMCERDVGCNRELLAAYASVFKN